MPQLLLDNGIEYNIQSFYNYFDQTFTVLIKKFLEEFWEQNFSIKLVSITKNSQIRNDKLSLGETYFTKNIENELKNTVYRFNSTLVKILLEESLGSVKPFNIANLTEFEIYLLTSFASQLNEIVKTNFVPLQNIQRKQLKHADNWNLVYYVKQEKYRLAKLVISIPVALIEPSPIILKNDAFNVPDNFKTQLRVKAGSTKLMLNELKELNKGDIVLLENSLINKMTVVSGDFLYDFKVNPDPSMMLELNEEEHDIGRKIMSDKNMWDDIQIEVSAEFDKVKMSLGELKQITSGMVIDLMDAFSGKISLVVEDKTVAKGDLVVINDRYGVKLTEIFSDTKQEPEAERIVISEKKHEKPIETSKEIEDDFDYSDFEDEGK